MKISFVLGIIGGIIAILIDFAVGFFPILAYDFLINDFLESFGYYLSSNGISQIGALISEVGGILGILGVIWGTKSGGVLMIISSILALIGVSVLGIMPFILMLVGGILILREKLPKSVKVQN